MINSVSNSYLVNNYSFKNVSNNLYNNSSLATYTTDSLSISNTSSKTSFFDRPEVRLGATMLVASASGAGIGYLVGSAFGRAGLGAAIGAVGVGVVPVALVGYALWKWGRNH
ncbi:MAG: hypothetical protein KatS3mg068_2127 [Candidatus Sericytochromatia bacterium]|nr:MAG: hypothetical protein KatS3mg068_2127 [Candidatus Sericytochromatia bacterium]